MNSKRASSIVGTFARYTEACEYFLQIIIFNFHFTFLFQKMMSFIDDTVAANPGIASSYIAGQTYEKRNLKVIVLKTPTSKRNIWIGEDTFFALFNFPIILIVYI